MNININKLITIILATTSFSVFAATDIEKRDSVIGDIKDKNYISLKTTLYNNDIDVLSRVNGYSILDVAMIMKDKRAAIIISDYNNSTTKERDKERLKLKIAAIEKKINNHSIAIKSSKKNQRNNESLDKEIFALKAERVELRKKMNQEEEHSSTDNRIEKLEKTVEFLMRNFVDIDGTPIDINHNTKQISETTINVDQK